MLPVQAHALLFIPKLLVIFHDESQLSFGACEAVSAEG